MASLSPSSAEDKGMIRVPSNLASSFLMANASSDEDTNFYEFSQSGIHSSYLAEQSALIKDKTMDWGVCLRTSVFVYCGWLMESA